MNDEERSVIKFPEVTEWVLVPERNTKEDVITIYTTFKKDFNNTFIELFKDSFKDHLINDIDGRPDCKEINERFNIDIVTLYMNKSLY